MSMSDCSKCWDTPCTCGYEYLHWSKRNVLRLCLVLLRVLLFGRSIDGYKDGDK